MAPATSLGARLPGIIQKQIGPAGRTNRTKVKATISKFFVTFSGTKWTLLFALNLTACDPQINSVEAVEEH